MKVGIVISGYHRGAGLERVAVEYARGLTARGHAVTVFAQRVQREPEDAGVSFVRVGGARVQPALRALMFPMRATRAVCHARPDVAIAFGSVLTIPAVVRAPGCHRSWWEFASREWPATTLDGMRRRLNPHHRVVLAWDHRILGGGVPRAVLAAATWPADDIRRFYPAVADRVRELPDGVNLEEFSYDHDGGVALRAEWTDGEGPLLFTVATELRRKGLGTMFEAFGIVRASLPGARLVVGGRVPAADVRALAVHHRVEAAVRAVGFVPDLRAAYSAADVLVFATRFDPWGLPLVESLACGTPVAASARAGAATHVVRAGSTGALITNPADASDVARAILEALALPRDRAALRASVEHLTWRAVVAQLEESLTGAV